MATKKQKRRREKERRHEYEYVYVDDEGREVEVEEPEAERKNGKSPAKRAVQTGGRTVDPPSWRKTLRRAAIFSPLMFVILYLLRPDNATPGSVVVSVALLMVFFIPFSFFMDSLMYRMAQKRAAKARGSSAK
jgi:hypothetical protein